MFLENYKSLTVREDKGGERRLYPRAGYDIIDNIIPNALEYVRALNYPYGMWLCGLNGVDILVRPNAKAKTLVEEWKDAFYHNSGLAMD